MDIEEIPTVVLLCLLQGLVAGLLRPRPSLKQIEQSSSSGKFHEWHTCLISSTKTFQIRDKFFLYMDVEGTLPAVHPCTHSGRLCAETGWFCTLLMKLYKYKCTCIMCLYWPHEGEKFDNHRCVLWTISPNLIRSINFLQCFF